MLYRINYCGGKWHWPKSPALAAQSELYSMSLSLHIQRFNSKVLSYLVYSRLHMSTGLLCRCDLILGGCPAGDIPSFHNPADISTLQWLTLSYPNPLVHIPCIVLLWLWQVTTTWVFLCLSMTSAFTGHPLLSIMFLPSYQVIKTWTFTGYCPNTSRN